MSDVPDVVISDNPERHQYEAYIDGELAGFAAYETNDDLIVFTHTEVLETFEGKGVGGTLARAALDDVREGSERQVVARCPFMQSWIDKHPEYAALQER